MPRASSMALAACVVAMVSVTLAEREVRVLEARSALEARLLRVKLRDEAHARTAAVRADHSVRYIRGKAPAARDDFYGTRGDVRAERSL